MKKTEKILVVQDLAQRFKEAKAIILVDYRGLTVSQMDALRKAVKRTGGQLLVVKNRLISRALDEEKIKMDDVALTGPTALMIAYQDEIAAIKTIFDFAKGTGLPSFKSGFWEERVLTKEEIEKLASLGSREQLITKFIGLLSSPYQRLILNLSGNQQKLIFLLKAKTKGGEN